MSKPILIYCYDAYCGWCYGFSPVMQELERRFRGRVQTEVVSGGMLRGDTQMPIASIAPFIAGSYRKVEEATGIRFGEEFLWHVRNPDLSDWIMDSTLPAVALCVFRDYFPDQQVAFASALQQALYGEGRDLCDDEAYRHLLQQFGIPPEEFYQQLHDTAYQQSADEDFEICRQLKLSGFPALYLQESPQKIHQLSIGYAPLKELAERTEQLLVRLEQQIQ